MLLVEASPLCLLLGGRRGDIGGEGPILKQSLYIEVVINAVPSLRVRDHVVCC